jgi:hypothetical protein
MRITPSRPPASVPAEWLRTEEGEGAKFFPVSTPANRMGPQPGIFSHERNFRPVWRPGTGQLGAAGRPEHIPTQQNRNRVSMLVALGWSNKRIAAALFVTLPSLPCGSCYAWSRRKTRRRPTLPHSV